MYEARGPLSPASQRKPRFSPGRGFHYFPLDETIFDQPRSRPETKAT
jgi:hypothetical protein